MRAVLVITANDLKQRMRDRSALLIAVVVPLALAFIFSQTLSGVSGGSITFRYAVVDLDQGDISQSFTQQLLGHLESDGVIELTTVDELEEGRQLAANGDVQATFVVPEGFSQSVMSNQAAEIQVLGNVDQQIATTVAQSIAGTFINQVRAVQVSVATAAMNLSDIDPQALAQRAAAFPDPIVIEDVSASRSELDTETFFAAGIAVFFLFFTVQFGVSGILDEKKQGTMSRLLAAPVSRASIIIGKLLTAFVLGIISMVVLALASTYLIGANWGNALGVGVLIVAGVVAAVAVMSLIASFAKTSEQAGNAQAVVALVLGMLGGSFFPVAQAGGVIESLSLVTPHAWFLRGLGNLQGGGGLSDIWLPVLAILAFAAVTGTAASLRLGKTVEQ